MKQGKIERLLDDYKAALSAANAAEQTISRLAAQLSTGASSSSARTFHGKGFLEHPASVSGVTNAPKRPSSSEIRAALENWDEARRVTRSAFKALKSTGSDRVPKSPNIRARELSILKRALSHGGFKTKQPPYPTVLEFLNG